jgi:predicted methyltransferase
VGQGQHTLFGNFHLPEKVDLFWTTLNYHDLHFDHAATPGSGTARTAALHRIDEATVIEEVKAAGFILAGESELLRNPADNHTKTVFDPAIRWKTDRFILKFRKP